MAAVFASLSKAEKSCSLHWECYWGWRVEEWG
jgi:hypothetical protein